MEYEQARRIIVAAYAQAVQALVRNPHNLCIQGYCDAIKDITEALDNAEKEHNERHHKDEAPRRMV